MSAPTALQLNRIAWMEYEAFYDADPVTGITWHKDAPKEALESFELWQAARA